MRYVVAYDVADDGRRRRVADALEGYGDRVQCSVFEVDVAPDALASMVDELDRLLEVPADALRVYRLCGACEVALTRWARLVASGRWRGSSDRPCPSQCSIAR